MSERPVRVAFVSSHATLGGSERYLELLLEHLGADWVAGVLVLQEGPFVDRMRRAGHEVDVVTVPARAGVPRATWAVRRAILRSSPQVVHANGLKAAVVAGVACLGSRIPVIWIKHDFARDGWLARGTALLCRRVVGVSRAVTSTFGARLQRRVDVVPNGIPIPDVSAQRGRTALRMMIGAPPDAPVVLLLGRVSPVKGQLELVEAAPALLADRPGVHLALVGAQDPSHPGYGVVVRERIAALGLGERVHLTGHRDNAAELLAGADVVAVPSGAPGSPLRGEGFGLVALEALSVSTPVVGYAAGALPEVLGDDCAILVPPGDRGGLARAIIRLLDDPLLRGELIAAGHRRLRDAYSVATMTQGMRACYRAAVTRR